MSETNEILTVFKKHWKTLLKWVLRIHNLPEITVDDLFERINSDTPPLLIDIRAPEDYNGTGYSTCGHIPNALSIPILELESKFEEIDSFREKEIVTMCPGGGLSLAAVEVLTEAGFKYVRARRVSSTSKCSEASQITA